MSSQVFAFEYRLFILLLNLKDSSYSLDISPLSDICLVNIFIHTVTGIVIILFFLMVYFDEHKFYILPKSNLQIILFMVIALHIFVPRL